MDLKAFHFAHPLWLLTLLAIPLGIAIFLTYYRKTKNLKPLEKFIDKHLIPYLLLKDSTKKKRNWIPMLFWALVWSCFSFSLAGPRWDFREIPTFSKDQSLAILLDLSESMNAKDISPSRLGRAKQKIEDLLSMSKGVKMGLIAYAADPHMIVPMTEDKETIRHLATSLDTDLVYVQGSKLAPALEMASIMLENEPGNNKAIVMISDGGFEDASAIHTAKKIAEKGIRLYTIGVGSLEGALLKTKEGKILKKNGSPILSKLEKEKFQEISKIGEGRYFDADHSGQIALIFEDLQKRSDSLEATQKTQRFWQERFYLFLLPTIPFFLFWYRRGFLFLSPFFFLLPGTSQASLKSYFLNQEQKACQYFEDADYESAVDHFQDPFRKGVSYYRLGDFKAAEEMFRQSTRPEVASSAAFNLGNALVKQNKLQEAVDAYEEVLKKWPDHTSAKENLEIVKKMLQEPPKNQENNKSSSKDKKNEDKKDPSSQKPKEENQPENKTSPEEPKSQENPPSTSQETKKEEENSPQEKDTPEPPSEAPMQQPPQTAQEKQIPRSQKDLDADLWLNQIKNDPKPFLKNKFYLESKKNGTKEEADPW